MNSDGIDSASVAQWNNRVRRLASLWEIVGHEPYDSGDGHLRELLVAEIML